jgi:hypothetical protein
MVICTRVRSARGGIFMITLSVLLAGKTFVLYVVSGGVTTVGYCAVIRVGS